MSALSFKDHISDAAKTIERPLISTALDAIIFYSLLALPVLTAIPYGASEPWWKAVFQSLVFILAALSVVEKWLGARSDSRDSSNWKLPRPGVGALVLPVVALIVFALIQTVSLTDYTVGTISNVPKTISSDPFQTRVFVIQVCALMLFGWMLTRYTYDRRRLFMVVNMIVAVGAASAAFGLWRQAGQHHMGFGLPFLRPGYGYAQFINSNHFAFLMEMGLGLAVGIAVARGVVGRRLGFYLAASLVMWVAVVRVNSRGGIVSMLCQLALLAILLVVRREEYAESAGKAPISRIRKIATRVILIAVLVTGGVLTVVLVGGDPLASRIDKLSIEFDSKTAETFALRQNVWQATFDLIKEHPIAGIGFGGYWIAITKYHRASGETTPQAAHNDYLELLASGGLIAVAIAIWFIAALVTVTRRALRLADSQDRAVVMGAGIGILTISVHSLVDFGLHVTIIAVVFTVLVALICAVEKRNTSLINGA